MSEPSRDDPTAWVAFFQALRPAHREAYRTLAALDRRFGENVEEERRAAEKPDGNPDEGDGT